MLLLIWPRRVILTDPYLAVAYVGKVVEFSGTLKSVFNNGLAVYLDFGTPHQEPRVLRARVWKKDWGNFPGPVEKIYRPGQAVWLTGKIKWYQADPVIDISKAGDIITIMIEE